MQSQPTELADWIAQEPAVAARHKEVVSNMKDIAFWNSIKSRCGQMCLSRRSATGHCIGFFISVQMNGSLEFSVEAVDNEVPRTQIGRKKSCA
jgi:hypothetical protein